MLRVPAPSTDRPDEVDPAAQPAMQPGVEPSASTSPWDDPRLPWKGTPTRADLLCWAGFSLTGLFGLAMLPLRPVVLAASPYVLAGLTGSATATVAIGAYAATGSGWWPLGLALATLGVMKFDPLFWWAGRLWGRGLVEIVAGRSARAARGAARAERVAERFGPAAVVLTYVLPVPSAVVYATVGAAGMRLRTFLLFDLVGALLSRSAYLWLGYRLGQSAVDVVDAIARVSMWISLGLVAVVLVGLWRRRRAGPAHTTVAGG